MIVYTDDIVIYYINFSIIMANNQVFNLSNILNLKIYIEIFVSDLSVLCACACVWMCVYRCAHVCMGVCMLMAVCVGVGVYIHTLACMDGCMCIHSFVRMRVHVRVCVCFKGFCYCFDLSMFRNIIIFTV